MPAQKSQVKVACLACRAGKTRCDGQQPCANCVTHKRDCHYRPSRRGGARRGERYENAKKQRTHMANANANASSTPRCSFDSVEMNSPVAYGIADLVNPFNEIEGTRDFIDSGISPEITPVTDHTVNRDFPDGLVMRAYRCEVDLVNAYYIFIHPYLPLLPLPAVPRFPDRPFKVSVTSVQPNKSSLPFWPTSPLGLAMMAILVLIPLIEDPHPISEAAIALRRSYADMYAQAALASAESTTSDHSNTVVSRISNTNGDQGPQSLLHPSLPLALEPVLALLLLGVYEYCQRANRKQMRSRVYHALTLSMDLSLHARGSMDTEGLSSESRVWWMIMYLVYQSAIFNHSSPIVLVHDERITTPFPDICGSRELLPSLMRAQDVLLKTGAIAKELTDEKLRGPYNQIRERICEMDSLILGLASQLDHTQYMNTAEGADASASKNLWLMARYLVHTARIKLHRFRAFRDYPVFLDKFCDLSSINSFYLSDYPQELSPDRLADIDMRFPFSEQESTNISLKAALALSRILRSLQWPDPSYSESSSGPKPPEAIDGLTGISVPPAFHPRYPRSLPYLACCGMQSYYVLITLLRKVHTSLRVGDLSTCYYLLIHPEPGTEREDAERLIEELRHGSKLVCDFMSSNAVFEGVSDMAREVETIYSAQLHD